MKKKRNNKIELHLDDREFKVLKSLMAQKSMGVENILRQALRTYQHVDKLICDGKLNLQDYNELSKFNLTEQNQ